MPVIILEGPEAAGKSTLAKRMSSMYNYPIHHFSYPKSDAEKANMFQMYQDFCYSTQDVIVDRCWYSEMVYGVTVRDKSHITLEQMYELEKMLISQGGALLIHCTAPINVLWKRFKARGDDYIKQDIEVLADITDSYEALMRLKHYIPVVRYEVNENMS